MNIFFYLFELWAIIFRDKGYNGPYLQSHPSKSMKIEKNT